MKNVTFFLVIAAFVGSVVAQPAQPSMVVERGRIAAERSLAQAGFALQDTACYKKFWVNDCLDRVKARRVEVLSDLRRQEVALNDEERKAQGAEQLQNIEEKSTLARQQAQANSLAETLNKAKVKNERVAQKAQGALLPSAEQAAQAQANQTSAANRLSSNQAKLGSRAKKQTLDAEEAKKFAAKQLKAKERQEKNAASQSGKTKSPVMPAPPVR